MMGGMQVPIDIKQSPVNSKSTTIIMGLSGKQHKGSKREESNRSKEKQNIKRTTQIEAELP